MKKVVIKGKNYQRDCDVVGETEMIKWFEVTNDGLKEVLGDDAQEELEMEYESNITNSFTPEYFYI